MIEISLHFFRNWWTKYENIVFYAKFVLLNLLKIGHQNSRQRISNVLAEKLEFLVTVLF